MLDCEERLARATIGLEARRHHIVSDRDRDRALARAAARGLVLSVEQRDAFAQVAKPQGLSTVVGYAGTGKSAMLGVAREAWESAGYRVQGAALSGIAAENLEAGSGIASRTIASLEHQWVQGRELLAAGDVLVIDEAGMIGTRQIERVLAEAERRGAKVVLVGDPEQLQAIEAGAAFRSITERHGAYELTNVRRQREDWQRDATRWLATERTAEAIAAYAKHGAVHGAETREQARAQLVDRWDRDRADAPQASRIILTHTNDEVEALNNQARERMRRARELGDEVALGTGQGERRFARGDRVLFLRNERSLGVKNGTLGTVESVSTARMAVMLDDGRSVAFDTKDYADVDHGYAATIHKAQGMTVDRVHVLATPGLDRHSIYVALSRHRNAVDLHYGRNDFADQRRLARVLSREREKDMASDYTLEQDRAAELPVASRDPFADLKLRSPAQQPSLFGERELASRARPRPTLEQAVARFARATAEIVHARKLGRQETPEQLNAFHAARHEIDAVRPEGARDLRSAFVRDMPLMDEIADGHTHGATAAMDWERRYRTNPQFRADHFVRAWRQLGDRHELFERHGDEGGARRVAGQMTQLAKTLERDPQVESLLRQRSKELGIPPFVERPLSQALPEWIGWGRGRGLGR